ncbi:uncharacterized protein EHS24_006429 [Apiotrichum porosum]|uniref:Uncharacterized protein n=1 Tax=Apiotrichum porosum TaxID=105984 RepID=A0A427Y1D3_9TREE|nr:uncharacterized protein EHS24_006429 [Apiotrichum porosum]RSH84891.1 hypothetical protein EHS24_006429 [Apiotrichum porosum]
MNTLDPCCAYHVYVPGRCTSVNGSHVAAEPNNLIPPAAPPPYWEAVSGASNAASSHQQPTTISVRHHGSRHARYTSHCGCAETDRQKFTAIAQWHRSVQRCADWIATVDQSTEDPNTSIAASAPPPVRAAYPAGPSRDRSPSSAVPTVHRSPLMSSRALPINIPRQLPHVASSLCSCLDSHCPGGELARDNFVVCRCLEPDCPGGELALVHQALASSQSSSNVKARRSSRRAGFSL